MIRTIFTAAVLFAGIATTGFAAEGPRLTGSGDNAQVAYDHGETRNVVGGGYATITGSTDNARVTYSGTTLSNPSGAGPTELAHIGQRGRGA